MITKITNPHGQPCTGQTGGANEGELNSVWSGLKDMVVREDFSKRGRKRENTEGSDIDWLPPVCARTGAPRE